MDILQVDNLKKYYGTEPNITRALNGVSIKVRQNEFVSIVGTSGSGKSTLLHIIGGLDTPSSGKIIVRGKKLEEMSDEELTIFRRRNIGFVFQNYNLVPTLNVYENIVLPVHLDGDTVDEKFLAKIVSVLGVEVLMERMTNSLSGGQQQRVAIARALITKPALLLADVNWTRVEGINVMNGRERNDISRCRSLSCFLQRCDSVDEAVRRCWE